MRETFRELVKPTVKTVEALKGVSLRIGRGEMVAYAGPNGAGKSTTIKLLSGLMVPDRGRVRVFGMDPAADRVSYVRNIAVVFGQRTELWWDHSIAASFRWKKSTWDIPDETYDRMLGLLTEQFDLGPIWKSLARELSLGQRMRADLALALLHDPELILLDEPTLGLDVIAREKMLDWIKHINAEHKRTVLITSHAMTDLEKLDARIVMVHNGSIRFDGGFEELRSTVADGRILTVTTDTVDAPELEGASLTRSEGRRHEYAFDASQVPVVRLLDALAERCRIEDIQTASAPIDEVVSQVYRRMNDGAPLSGAEATSR
ncbi:ABC transporter ATP-binding protein [Glycomyces rhizosphaerae]|uniref:ATP-binding cassette domain-containing protein n=1 Tax=Glycomyces rhizosphaerae TaxID=2054422 RepID=A0ABV7Q9P7_9ACTN